MSVLKHLIDSVIHLDQSLNGLADTLGPWLYGLLFLIVFAETGLVVTPFLPGDSLLFAVGALSAAEGSPINLPMVAGLLIVGAVLGDAVNYAVGKWLGPKVFAEGRSRLLNRDHLEHARRFYDRHGGKTIILARFIPIVRTFAPFVAGIGRMSYPRFAAYNVAGGVAWVSLFLTAGWGFGNVPVVKRQFHYVILGIIVVSVLPALWEVIRARRASKRGESARLEVATVAEDPSEV